MSRELYAHCEQRQIKLVSIMTIYYIISQIANHINENVMKQNIKMHLKNPIRSTYSYEKLEPLAWSRLAGEIIEQFVRVFKSQ